MGSPCVPLPESIIRFLDEAQNSTSTQHKLVNGLVALYDRTDNPEGFFEAFFQPFSNLLLVYKREPAVERVVTFISKFAAKVTPKEKDGDFSSSDDNDEEEDGFLSLLIDKLLELHEAKDKAVRFRVCQLVAKLLGEATEASCRLSSDLLDRVQKVMLIRVQDKIPVVRVHAVSALQFFQEPEPDCPVAAVLLELMEKDSSPEVRRCVLNNIVPSDQSLPAVIKRTSDIKEQIRRDAFLWLANPSKCEIKHLSIGRRIHLLSVGLRDLSDMVVEACVNGLLRQWSLECNDGDFINLLARLDVENSSDVVELALLKLFANFPVEELVSSMRSVLDTSNGSPAQGAPSGPDGSLVLEEGPGAGPQEEPQEPGSAAKLLSRDYMYSEEVFYWSCLCRYLHSKREEGREGLEQLLPTLSEFADYIHSYIVEVVLVEIEDDVKKVRSVFVAQQLCSMLVVCDLSDEFGRSRLASLVCDVLSQPEIPVAIIPPLLQLQSTIWPQEAQRIEKLAEIIAEQRQPSLPGVGEDTVESSSHSQDDSQLSPASTSSTCDGIDTLLRCLTIACELLKGLRRHKLDNPVILTLADSLLFPCIQNVSPYVRDMSLHCLGLASLLDLSIARKHILLFLQVTQVDHEMVQATALKVVFDLLHVYGFEKFSAVPQDSMDVAGGGAGQEDMSNQSEKQEVEEEKEEEEGGEDGEDAKEEEQGSEEPEDKGGITQRLLAIMVSFLDGESQLLRGVAGEGIGKLLLSGRVLSRKLLAKLLLLWYNPITQEETDLRSVLGLFFPAFAALSRDSRLSLSEVYLPVVRMVLEAPPTSPLASVDTNNLSDFLLQLTQPLPGSSEESVHDSLAIAVCNECLKDPASVQCRIYCRTLSLMTLTSSNKSNAVDLLALCGEMEETVADRASLRYLRKFREALAKISPDSVESTPDNAHSPKSETESEVVKSEVVKSEEAIAENKDMVNSICNGHVEEGEEEDMKKNIPPASIRTAVPLKEVSVSILKLSRETVQQVAAESKARNRRKKEVKVKSTARKTKRKKRATPLMLPPSDEEEESESENIVPEDIDVLPKRITHHRAAKSAARQYVDSPLRELTSQMAEDSDDSTIGEHSPFVKHTTRRRSSNRKIQPLKYDEDEDA